MARVLLGGICYWLFLGSVFVSGLIGVWLPLRFWDDLWTYPVAMPMVAGIAFVVIYRIMALGIITLVEKSRRIEFERPPFWKGVLYSAAFTYVIAAGFVLIVLLGLGEFLSNHRH